MLAEPLTEGMSAGHVVPLEPMLAEYYRLRGWDPEGRPTPDKLAALRV
jgi:aldehyde:ferredoxin oxidoreductase